MNHIRVLTHKERRRMRRRSFIFIVKRQPKGYYGINLF